MESFPWNPWSRLSPPSPIRVSARVEPQACSNPERVSPAAWPPETAPVARFTDTPPVSDPKYDTQSNPAPPSRESAPASPRRVSSPAPPSRVLAPALPTRESAWAEPSIASKSVWKPEAVSASVRVSPAASPPETAPVARFTDTPAAVTGVSVYVPA